MKPDLTGLPSVVNAKSTATGIAIAEPIVTPAPLENSMNGVVRDLLDRFEGEAVIVVDPNTRKVYAATGATGTNLQDVVTGVVNVNMTNINPDAGQEGRSLMWTPVALELVTLTQAAQDAITAATAAAKPKRSVESLVAASLNGDFPEGEAPLIVIDQVNGKVQVLEGESVACAAALDAIVPAEDQVVIEFDEPAETVEGEPLVFEGGAV
jgi:hypothetical protein